MRYETLKQRAEEYATSFEGLGWPEAEALEAKAAGQKTYAGAGQGVAVLVRLRDPERAPEFETHAVLLYDEWDDLVADSEDPGQWGWPDV